MAPKTEKELSEESRAAWLKALCAMQLKNYAYVIQLTQGILQKEPNFLAARELLRKAESKTDHPKGPPPGDGSPPSPGTIAPVKPSSPTAGAGLEKFSDDEKSIGN
jgi:hypothetical protein